MKLAIIQPSYIPWRGYFHQIQKADVFMFYDDVQYDKHGWRNRNRVKTKNGTIWLTIPVAARGNVVENTPIHEIRCASKRWAPQALGDAAAVLRQRAPLRALRAAARGVLRAARTIAWRS